MERTLMIRRLLPVLILMSVYSFAAKEPLKFWRIGNPNDVPAQTQRGYALMGGGSDQDAAFKFLCDRSGGGDFLILTASGDDDYNPYIQKLCRQNSVTTVRVADLPSASDPRVVEAIDHAEAVFITGGDQSDYVKFWKPSPMRAALQRAIDRGVPLGGTSAGLAILGEFGFAALNDTAYSKPALSNPYDERITIDHDFLKVPYMKSVITDTHFKKRDRLGRTLVFMARILQDAMASDVHSMAVDERSAVLVDEQGNGTVVGTGTGAYFYHPTQPPSVCKPGQPLTFENIDVVHVSKDGTFNVAAWTSTQGTKYRLDVRSGVIQSTSGALY